MQNSLSATTTYTTDPFGNLYQVTYPSSSYSRYYYDAQNKLVGRYYPTNYTRMFIREDDFRISAIAYTNGTLQKIFYYATGAITPDYMDIAGIKYRIITNHLGSPRLVVRLTDGVVVQRMDYNVLGQVTYDSYPQLQPYGFAGGLYDSDSGLVHFGARKYDTYTGRWTTKDPIRFDGGDTNLYGYVMNDPVNLVDPEGKAPWFLAAAVAAGVMYATDLETPGAAQSEMLGVPSTVVGVKAARMMCQVANSNRYLRIGVGDKYGNKVFRAAGEVVEWLESKGVPGIKKGKIDFFDLGPK